MDLLLDRPAWYVLGPLIGLVVLGLYTSINERFGVLGGYSNVVERASGRIPALGWKAWLLLGVLGGSLAYRLVSGSPPWATAMAGSPGPSMARVGTWRSPAFCSGLLLVAGALIGFGAK